MFIAKHLVDPPSIFKKSKFAGNIGVISRESLKTLRKNSVSM